MISIHNNISYGFPQSRQFWHQIAIIRVPFLIPSPNRLSVNATNFRLRNGVGQCGSLAGVSGKRFMWTLWTQEDIRSRGACSQPFNGFW
jgi:hypothetical protein